MALGDRRILEPSSPRPPRRTGLFTPPVPWVCVFVLGLSIFTLVVDETMEQLAIRVGGLVGPAVVEGQWWRPFTAQVIHGNAFHLFFNMTVLYWLGLSFERVIGSWRFLLISISSAMGTSALALLFNWNVTTVGASGMILGWAGAMLPNLTRQSRRQLSGWLIQVAIISILPLFLPIPISTAGHFGGFLFGLPGGLLLRRKGAFIRYMPIFVAASVLAMIVAAYAGRTLGGA